MSLLATLILSLAPLAALWFTLRWLRRPSHRLPPGPHRHPIIGNLLTFPTINAWETYKEWSKIYGDMIYLTLMGQSFLILNTQSLAVALLEKKGNIYSDRPQFPMAGDLVGWRRSLALGSYGPRVRDMRKHLHNEIEGDNVKQFKEHTERQVDRFLHKLLQSPQDFLAHIRWLFGSIALSIGYGYEVQASNDPNIALAQRTITEFSEAARPGVWLVDLLPWLKYFPAWLPGMTFMSISKKYAETLETGLTAPYFEAKRNIERSTGYPSLVSKVLQGQPDITSYDEEILMWSANSITLGGTETSICMVSCFFMAMALYPEVQNRAQRELTSIVSEEKAPSFEDKSALPYTTALVTEVLRWGNAISLGVPHRLTEDDNHNGYFIPKGTVILVNMRGILQDDASYPEPKLFNPERFLGDSPQPDPRKTIFGYGRRKCPGLHYEDQSLFLVVSKVLHSFDIGAIPGSLPKVEYTQGVISQPLPFKCTIEPRHAGIQKLWNSS